MDTFLNSFTITFLWQATCIAITMGLWQRWQAVARAPLLDIIVSALTWIPWLVSGCLGGWIALVGCIFAQAVSLLAFSIWHEKARRQRGPTIHGTLNRIVGRRRNHIGLWVTVPALPVFLTIRFAQIAAYPWLVRVLDFPNYKHGEWVNVTRQKFQGLLGHDLVWCLYCDWMTGVYSLGAEMLRNVESFWCPIKFYDGKKCDNCKLDFPDVEKWVEPDKMMKHVTAALKERYPAGKQGYRSWWSHPERKSDCSGCSSPK